MGSGFFFWGMMLLPVETASLGVMKPNSSDAYRTHCTITDGCYSHGEPASRRGSRILKVINGLTSPENIPYCFGTVLPFS